MVTNVGELGAIGAAQGDLVADEAALPEVEVDQGDHAEALVRLGALGAGPACDVLPGPEDHGVHGGGTHFF